MSLLDDVRRSPASRPHPEYGAYTLISEEARDALVAVADALINAASWLVSEGGDVIHLHPEESAKAGAAIERLRT